jgi:tetratricopeptide (TPR) repeat protein/tRNA A-37 threonylcarbamoyl transferase component Bud32
LPRERWAALLADACGTDAGLRVEVEHLLLHYDRADTLLDHPAVERFGSLLGDVAAPPPELVNGNYRIERKLGQGGMATVYLAHDLRHDRKVAVKILHPELSAAFRAERFLAEIRTMAQLRHPYILPLFDSGTADGVLFYVMPYVEGETLRQHMDREVRLSLADAARIAGEVAAALDSAHRHGVVHRDIKPENVLLGEGSALVADFGIALAISTATSPERNQPGWVAGTPRYMSPEQMSGEGAIDPRSDVYALGVVMYEMLAGRPPFLSAGSGTPPSSLHALRPEIPAAAEAVVAKSMARLPVDRYRTAGELATAFRQSLAAPARRWNLAVAVALAAATGTFLAGGERWGATRSPVESTSVPAMRPHQTRSLGAYDLYLRGREQALSRSDSGQRLAIQYFKQAIAADSTYAAAHAELAHMYALGFARGLPRSSKRQLALGEALKAVAMDSTLVEGFAELGFVRMHDLYDMKGAAAALDRALALDPSSARVHGYLAQLYQWTERPAESLAEARRAKELDPLSVLASIDLASALYISGHYDAALVELDRLQDVDPPVVRASWYQGNIYLSKGMWAEALGVLRDGDAWSGRALAMAGRTAEAERYLADALNYEGKGDGDAFSVAILYEALGDYDRAFAWLDKSLEDHSLWYVVMWPTFDRLRADPRFTRIRERLRGGVAQ